MSELHDVAAQKAAEESYEALIEDDVCTCETCVVRVVLEAAWPHLLESAREEVATGVLAPDMFIGEPSKCDNENWWPFR